MDSCSCCSFKPNVNYKSPISLSSKNDNILISLDFKCLEYISNENSINYEFDIQNLRWLVKNNVLISKNDNIYKLIEIHSHVEGEHEINGVKSDCEYHYVFKSVGEEAYYVVAALFKIHNMVTSDLTYNLARNLPTPIPYVCSGYYLYDGGLTGPGSETPVSWLVISEIMDISTYDYEILKSKSRTSMKLQNRHGRIICYKR